jgi:hypothetical protein
MTEQMFYGFTNHRRGPRFFIEPPPEPIEVEPEETQQPQQTQDLASEIPQEPETRKFRPALDPQIALLAKMDDAGPPQASDHHSRKCQICQHPEREMIEHDFLLWRTPRAIIREFDIAERSLYRHAHAKGLFTLRRENLRLTLDRVLERGSQIENTGDTIIRAVRAQACLTDDNRWVEPAKRMIVINETPPNLIDSPTIRNAN